MSKQDYLMSYTGVKKTLVLKLNKTPVAKNDTPQKVTHII